MNEVLLEKKKNRDIIALLMVSKITPLEKKVWLRLLEVMTDAEKDELITNLEAEVQYEMKATDSAIDEFLEKLKGTN